jgi:N-acylneuraminate cytidylyltransferase
MSLDCNVDLSKVLAVIPARGGSRRLPAKNMRSLAGVPLVGRAIDHAKDAGIKHITVSSDDDVTLAYARSVDVFAIKRPAEISQGDTPPIWNVRHAMKVVDGLVPVDFQYIVYLQPTSPFRRAEDIISSLNVISRTGADAVVTVKTLKEVPFEIGFAGRLRIMPRSESSNAIVAPNGAVYVITADHLERGGDWWDGITMAHIMPEELSLDIDVREDFEAAERLAETMKAAGVL